MRSKVCSKLFFGKICFSPLEINMASSYKMTLIYDNMNTIHDKDYDLGSGNSFHCNN